MKIIKINAFCDEYFIGKRITIFSILRERQSLNPFNHLSPNLIYDETNFEYPFTLCYDDFSSDVR